MCVLNAKAPSHKKKHKARVRLIQAKGMASPNSNYFPKFSAIIHYSVIPENNIEAKLDQLIEVLVTYDLKSEPTKNMELVPAPT